MAGQSREKLFREGEGDRRKILRLVGTENTKQSTVAGEDIVW